jgi:hypothetical protein
LSVYRLKFHQNTPDTGIPVPGVYFYLEKNNSLLLPDISDALLTDILSPVGYQSPGTGAENAGRLILLENNPIILHVNFQLIPLGNVQGAAKLYRKHDSSQFIYLSNNTR